MEEFFNSVIISILLDSEINPTEFNFFQVEDIKSNIENIQKYVNEVKRLHSNILAAPNTDDSMWFFFLLII